MAFDREAAKNAGYTDQEIDQYLSSQRKPIQQTQPTYQPFGARGNPLLESVLQGATFGFSDEMQAGAKTAFDKLTGSDKPWGELYRENVKEVRAPYEEYQKESPMSSMGLSLLGGLGTGGVIAKGVQSAAPQVARFAQVHPLLSASAGGAGAGVVSGAGFAPTMEDIPEYSASGMLTGAAFPPLLAAGGKVSGVVTTPLKAAARKVTGSLDTPTQRAAKMVVQALQRDEISLDQAMKRLDDLGPEAKMVDIGGVNVQKLAQTIASTPGKAAQQAEDILQSRMMGSPERLVKRMTGIFKQNKSAYRYMKDTIESRKQQAGPLYKEAFEVDANVPKSSMDEFVANLNSKVSDFEGTSIGRQLNAVKRSLLSEGKPKLAIKKLHAAKMDLDQKIADSYKDHRATPLTAELMGLKRGLLDILDSSENYKQARKIFSDDSSVLSAIDLGKKILRTDAEEMKDLLAGMSDAEKKGFISGAMQAIGDKFKGTQEGANAARKVASPLVKERIRNAFSSKEEYERFVQGLEAEDVFAEVRNNVLRGSQTQPRGMAAESAADDAAALMQGRWLSASMDAIRKFFTGNRQIPEPVRDDLAEMLFSDVAAGKDKISRELAKRLKRHDISAKYVEGVLTSLRQGMPVAAGETGAILEQ